MSMWVWIIIFIASLIILFVLLQVIVFFIMKKNMNKAFNELDKLAIFEKERFEKINNAFHFITKNRKINNEEIISLIKKQEKIASDSQIEMENFKNTNDFIIMYLMKFLEEKKLKNKDDFAPTYNELKSISYFNINDKNNPYKKYNRIANSYNSLSSMSFISKISKKSGYYKAPIL